MLTVIRRFGLIYQPSLGRRECKGLMHAMLKALGLPSDMSLTLVMTDDQESAELNNLHLACLGPTNILSFPADEENNLGALVLNAQALRRESLLYGQLEEQHMVRLLAHGLGHLLGYDHGPEMDALSDAAFCGGLEFLLNNASGAYTLR